jgi:spermidine/putrescine-binding protein
MDDLKRQRLKLIVRNLKQLLDALESEVFSDVDAYRYENYKELNPTIDDYDEVFDDDDGWTD